MRIVYCCSLLIQWCGVLIASAQVQVALEHSLFSPSTAPQPGAGQGYSVAVDGGLTIAGAPFDDVGGQDSGVAKIYSTTTGALLHVINNPYPGTGRRFGTAACISGTRVVIGEVQSDSCFVYNLSGAVPTNPVAVLQHPAKAIDISGSLVVAGSPNYSSPGSWVGQAWIYDVASATPGQPILTLTNPAPTTDDEFARAVAISGSLIAVGVPREDAGAADAGTVYVYDLTKLTPTIPVLTLTNPAPASSDRFGSAVAIDGMRLVVGASGDDAGAPDAGSVYVYDLASPTPASSFLTLTNPFPALRDYFGWTVAVSGQRVAVGAYADDAEANDSGRTFIYNVSGSSPNTPVATLVNPTPESEDYFGYSVDIQGTRVVVGAYGDNARAFDAGIAYVYDLSLDTMPLVWLDSPSPAGGDLFGSSVAVSGTRFVVGAPLENTGAEDAGSAYVFDSAGDSPAVPVVIHNPTPGIRDRFGLSVGISGTRVVIGAGEDDTGATDAGAAYVFEVSSSGSATLVTTLNNPSPVAYEMFGLPVGISGDLVAVASGSDDAGAPDAGVVYVYDLSSSTAVPRWTLNNPEPARGDFFGYSLGISGTLLAIGTPFADTPTNVDSGRVYVYELASVSPTTPALTLTHPDPQAKGFGARVALGGTRVVVASGQSLEENAPPSLHVFDLASSDATHPITALINPFRPVFPATTDYFGNSLAISGTQIVVGAQEAGVAGWQTGAAYVYDLTANRPELPVATLTNSPGLQREDFAYAVGIDDGIIVVGAPRRDTVVSDKGAAYVFAAAPKLAIEQGTNGVQISWPWPSTGFTLEKCEGLNTSAPLPWSPVTSVYRTNDQQMFLATNSPSASTFYRLRKQ
jgi:hypothetical protein